MMMQRYYLVVVIKLESFQVLITADSVLKEHKGLANVVLGTKSASRSQDIYYNRAFVAMCHLCWEQYLVVFLALMFYYGTSKICCRLCC